MTLSLLIAAALAAQQHQAIAERLNAARESVALQQRGQLDARWAAEDAWAKAQKGRKATREELDRLVVPGEVKR